MTTARDTHLADQFQAATADVDSAMLDVAVTLDRPLVAIRKVGGPVGDRIDQWELPPTRHCGHVDDIRPVGGLLALPGVLICLERCLHTVARDHADDHAGTCDACNTSGLDTFREVTITVGPVLVIGHVCPDCAAASGLMLDRPTVTRDRTRRRRPTRRHRR